MVSSCNIWQLEGGITSSERLLLNKALFKGWLVMTSTSMCVLRRELWLTISILPNRHWSGTNHPPALPRFAQSQTTRDPFFTQNQRNHCHLGRAQIHKRGRQISIRRRKYCLDWKLRTNFARIVDIRWGHLPQHERSRSCIYRCAIPRASLCLGHEI